MNEYYQLWKKQGSRWIRQNSITSGGWNVRQAGEYKTNKCTNGFWGTPETHTITDSDLEDTSAFGACYIAHGSNQMAMY